MLGELRAMAIAIPGAQGIFSHLQAALQARNVTQGRFGYPTTSAPPCTILPGSLTRCKTARRDCRS
jgi:hypothetical protein